MELIPSSPYGLVVVKTTNPCECDDCTVGIQLGTLWINTTTVEAFVCTASTPEAAAWTRLALYHGVAEGTFVPTLGVKGRSDPSPAAGDLYTLSAAVGRFTTMGSRAFIDLQLNWTAPPANASGATAITIQNTPMTFASNVGGSLAYASITPAVTGLVWGGDVGTTTVRLYTGDLVELTRADLGETGQIRLSYSFTYA